MTDPTRAESVAETQRRNFEDAWIKGSPFSIEEALQTVPSSQRLETLEELVSIEMELGWRQSHSSSQTRVEKFLVESYLARFADLNQPQILRRLVREEYLARQRYGDAPEALEYFRRFPSLFDSENIATEFLSAIELSARPWIPGQKIGQYQLVEKHATGGFGEVWRAHDTKFDRVVAIKRMSRSLANRAEFRHRFARESASTARLQHPGIVPIHDAGIHKEDVPYYVMRFVEGETLSDAITSLHSNERPDPIEKQRLLDHFLSLCRTIAFAHSKGTIHRDLKPQNVVLGEFGETMVLDWGLAKSNCDETDFSLDSDGTVQSDQAAIETQHGTILGTPKYMSPEQARGNIEGIDLRSDVYALGVVLFELLTGSTPDPSARHSVHPSSAADPVLLAVCKKAMSEDPSRRYESAGELVQDLERYLADESIHSFREPWVYRVRRQIRRHPRVTTSLLVAAAVTTILVGVINAIVVQANRRLAEEERESTALRLLAEENLNRATRNLYFQRVLLAASELENNNVTRAKTLLAACPEHLRGWEWFYLERQSRIGDPRDCTPSTADLMRAVAFDPSGGSIAVADNGGKIFRADTESNSRVHFASFPGRPREIAYLPNQQLAVGGTVDGLGVVQIFDVEGRVVTTFQAHDRPIGAIAVSPDGRWLASGGADRIVRCWDTSDWTMKEQYKGHAMAVTAIAFSFDNASFVTGSLDKTVIHWDRTSGERIRTFTDASGPVHAIAFHPQFERIAVGHDGTRILLYDLQADAPPTELIGHGGQIRSLEFSPDGKTIASASYDRTVRIWRWRGSDAPVVLRGHNSHLRDVAFSPSGDRLVSISDDSTAKLWTLEDSWSSDAREGSMVCYSPKGEFIAIASDQKIRVFATVDNRELARFSPEDSISEIRFLGEEVLGVGYGIGRVELLSIESNQRKNAYEGDSPILTLCPVDVENEIFAVGNLDGDIVLWDHQSASPIWKIHAHPRGVACIEFDTQSNTLISCGRDALIKRWQLEDGVEKQSFKGHRATVMRVAIAPNGATIASCSYDGTVRVWSPEGETLRELQVGNQWVNCLAYSPDGTRLVSGSEETVKLWDTTSWEEVMSISGHQCIQELGFRPDGSELALAGIHRGFRILQSSPSQ